MNRRNIFYYSDELTYICLVLQWHVDELRNMLGEHFSLMWLSIKIVFQHDRCSLLLNSIILREFEQPQ